jgi:multiple sugar transport system substrate-binding protein
MKKFLLVTMLLVFAIMFAACNGKNNTNDDSTSTPTPAPTSDGGITTDSGEKGNIHPYKDFGGKVLSIGAWWDTPIGAIMWGDEPDRGISTNYPIARLMWDNARRIEAKYNVKFESRVVGNTEFLSTLVASVMEGNPFADLIILDGPMIMDAMGNVIQPWDGASGLANSDLFGERRYVSPCTFDAGGIWTINQNGVDAQAFGLGVNLNIINNYGLSNPIELFERGEWTWDAMLDLMRRATLSTTGDGVIDQFGIAGQPGDIIQHLIGANDGSMVDADNNYGFNHPHTIRALEFAQQIFNERLWAAETGGVMDTGNWERNFYSGLRDGNAALFPATIWAFDNAPPSFEFGFVPFPTGPNNTSGSTWLAGFKQGIGVSIGTDWAIEDLLIIIEELFSWPGDEPEILFESGDIDWMRETYRTEADVQRAIYAGITRRTDIGRAISPYYWILGMFASNFWNHEMGVSDAVEYHRGPHQEMLDMRFRVSR